MKITSNNLAALCTSEAERFTKHINSGSPNVRIGECQIYRGIYAGGAEWAKTLPEGTMLTFERIQEHSQPLAAEVSDCCAEGSYDHYFEDGATQDDLDVD